MVTISRSLSSMLQLKEELYRIAYYSSSQYNRIFACYDEAKNSKQSPSRVELQSQTSRADGLANQGRALLDQYQVQSETDPELKSLFAKIEYDTSLSKEVIKKIENLTKENLGN